MVAYNGRIQDASIGLEGTMALTRASTAWRVLAAMRWA